MITLPPLGLGTAPIGGLFREVTEQDAAATVEAAVREGVTYFDTAPRYGHGLAEERLGRTVRAAGVADPVISTKTGWLLRPGEKVVTDWTERGIRESLESSLERLQRSFVDILYLHDPDDYPEEVRRTAYPAVRRLRDEGLVGAIGFGMNHSGPLAAYVAEFDVDVVLIAGRFSLLDHDALGTLLPLCRRRGTAVVVGGVFNTGLLADPHPGAMFDYRPVPGEVLARAERCRAICAEFGVPLSAAAIQFPFLHPAVRSVVVGCRSAAEVTGNAESLRLEIPPELWHRLAGAGFVPPELLEA
ncbi:D-threo-aldose 1-dehydrogenase [Streptosporangium becharense]|uniref:D-threo-aldose 1-dehydrogenase n=1 Tax=Streptosporangium becharense TaxID=1816182 RepID=A0A7W9MDN4_9ACTN|nr:aldo/keto reductase [Streptosporangium becharense]MBB2915347.1 D-threo-aldose 1-dehydrogenase [Streptosporangium becharense]MBB5816955.1 D-threo-aldose 1-dehydrogenase [Streptosporangium becharense]